MEVLHFFRKAFNNISHQRRQKLTTSFVVIINYKKFFYYLLFCTLLTRPLLKRVFNDCRTTGTRPQRGGRHSTGHPRCHSRLVLHQCYQCCLPSFFCSFVIIYYLFVSQIFRICYCYFVIDSSIFKYSSQSTFIKLILFSSGNFFN